MAKGGKRPGAGRKKAPHTIEAEAAKARLVEIFVAQQEPIYNALISQARKGNVQAIRELFERVWGKVKEQHELSGKDGAPIPMSIDLKSASADELLKFLTTASADSFRVHG